MERYKIYGAVYVILKKEDKILFMLRDGTGYKDGEYSLPSGHLDKGETFSQAAIRETKEETGVRVHDLKPVVFMHRKSSEKREYMDVFFLATKWEGEPKILESNKCSSMGWFADPPAQTIDYVKEVLQMMEEGIIYKERFT